MLDITTDDTTRNAARGATSGDRRERSTPRAKLASVVADRMVADITAAGWPAGQVFGSEADLLERYGVSRAVFREAVRLLEHQQVGRMRRGPGGGLVVTEPSVDAVIDAVAVYLLFIEADLAEVFEARLALERAAAELATERVDEAMLVRLREHAAIERDGTAGSHRDLHNLVAEASGNPALAFFVDLLNRVTLLYAPGAGSLSSEARQAGADAHQRIIESIVGGNVGQAGGRMRRHLEAEVDFIRRRRPRRPRLDEVFAVAAGGTKMGEAVARQLFGEITAAGWPVGQPLGSEPELMERLDVSRAVLREAVRVLEHHQIARMRRGPGGGLFVAEPGVEASTDAVAIYLGRREIELPHVIELRRIVEVVVLDRVIENLDDEGRTVLQATLAQEQAVPASTVGSMGHGFHDALGGLSGNRVLSLLTGVLGRLSRGHAAAISASGVTVRVDEIVKAHERIVQAVLAGDADLARHRLRRHLDAIVAWRD